MNATLTSSNDFLTPAEIAQLLKISKSAVYKYAAHGILPAFKIAGNIRFLKSDVMQKIEDLRKTAYGFSR